MARGVSYFQRYSQPENHATNNTLLALRYFYQASHSKIENLLTDLFEIQFSIGLAFQQQVKSVSESPPKAPFGVPDALISQEAFRIFVETKMGGRIDVDQIRRHFATISAKPLGAEKEKSASRLDVLVALTKEPIAETLKDTLIKEAREKSITFVTITFSRLLEALGAQCAEYEPDLRAVLEDFRSYLDEADLLDERNKWLVIFPCGSSFQENVRFGVYYESPTRPSKASYPFIGIYRQKTVSHVGHVDAVAVVTLGPPGYTFEKEMGELTEDQKSRIVQTIEETSYYDLKSEALRFYVVDRFVKTDARKGSPNGIMGFRYLDLSELIEGYSGKENFTSESLAAALTGIVWK